MPRVVGADDRPRHRFHDELERVGELPNDLAALVHEVADDLRVGAPMA